jgi:hypothetical protein
MRLRLAAALIVVTIAAIAWFVSALALERQQEKLRGASVVRVDYQQCLTVKPGPIVPRRKWVLHPDNSELT